MSTQTSSEGTPLTISEPQQNLRLLELPPELLDLLSTPNPPRLYFKSSSPKTSNSNGNSSSAVSAPTTKTAEYLHLCTPTQTYQVRQVSTSNSVYVLQPSATRPTSADGDASTTDSPNHPPDPATATATAMTAISAIDTLLELLPVTPAIKPMLQSILPIYNNHPDSSLPKDQITHFLSPSNSTPLTKSTIFSDMPAPTPQIESIWREILAFEFQGRCARPAPATALGVWKSILDYASLDHLDLASSLDGGMDISGFLASEQQGGEGEEMMSPLDKTIAAALLFYLDNRDSDSSNTNPNSTTTSWSRSHSLRLDRTRTVRWMGMTLLQSLSLSLSQKAESESGEVGVGLDTYLSQWRDLLPEKWRGDVGLDRLGEGCYTVIVTASVAGERREVIVWNGDGMAGEGVVPGEMVGVEKTATATTTTTGGKRKWHEKFKGQRKEVKK